MLIRSLSVLPKLVTKQPRYLSNEPRRSNFWSRSGIKASDFRRLLITLGTTRNNGVEIEERWKEEDKNLRRNIQIYDRIKGIKRKFTIALSDPKNRK